MDAGKGLGIQDIMQLYTNGMIGFKESRIMLASVVPLFARVRDEELEKDDE